MRSFLYTSVYSCHLFLISSASVRSITFLSFFWAHLCMKCPLGISNILEEILVFPILLFSSIYLHWSLSKAFLSLLAIHYGETNAKQGYELPKIMNYMNRMNKEFIDQLQNIMFRSHSPNSELASLRRNFLYNRHLICHKKLSPNITKDI